MLVAPPDKLVISQEGVWYLVAVRQSTGDCQDGQMHQNILWQQCVGYGDNQGHHVASSGGRGVGAPPSTQSCVTLIVVVLEDGVQR
jgi:hypothetical protein